MTAPVVVCLKWVSHPGEPQDVRFAGMSAADRSALELALRQAEQLGTGAVAVTVGPDGADHVLRDALACGAARAIRVNAPVDSDSAAVAAAIVGAVPDAAWVWCGDYSLDRGSGSVPAFVAAGLGARQALGVIAIEPGRSGTDDGVTVTRRLDGGRRELLSLRAPAVVSVEGATAHLRRATLGAVRAAAQAPIEVLAVRTTPDHHSGAASTGAPAAGARPTTMPMPYRPRARALDAPPGDAPLARLRSLTDAAAASSARGEQVTLAPEAAAARIVEALRAWGYLA